MSRKHIQLAKYLVQHPSYSPFYSWNSIEFIVAIRSGASDIALLGYCITFSLTLLRNKTSHIDFPRSWHKRAFYKSSKVHKQITGAFPATASSRYLAQLTYRSLVFDHATWSIWPIYINHCLQLSYQVSRDRVGGRKEQ